MKPAPFEYVRPSRLDEVFAALAQQPEAAILAGGQSLLAMANMRLIAPSHLIDITGLAALRDIAVQGEHLRIGALVRHCQLEQDETIARHAPLLHQAAVGLAHPAIRNRGTIGGSLALADPAAELPACVMALGARLEITGQDGTRQVAADDFFRGPFETALAHDELLTAIELPLAGPLVGQGQRAMIEKLARRHGDYALAGLALAGRLDGDRVAELRLVYFGVGDRPTAATTTAGRLTGAALSDAAIDAAADGLGDDLQPIDQPGCSAATKLHLAKVLTRRLLRRLHAPGEAQA